MIVIAIIAMLDLLVIGLYNEFQVFKNKNYGGINIMGKLLKSGNGKKNWAAVIICIIVLFTGVIGGFVMFAKADKLRGDEKQMFQIYAGFLIFMGIITIFPILKHSFSARSRINVYERGIEGDGLGTSKFSLLNFKLSYDQISNVDVIRKVAVVIHTSGAQYTCFASNCTEIRDTILRMKNYRG